VSREADCGYDVRIIVKMSRRARLLVNLAQDQNNNSNNDCKRLPPLKRRCLIEEFAPESPAPASVSASGELK
jgi:hypothetical protein